MIAFLKLRGLRHPRPRCGARRRRRMRSRSRPCCCGRCCDGLRRRYGWRRRDYGRQGRGSHRRQRIFGGSVLLRGPRHPLPEPVREGGRCRRSWCPVKVEQPIAVIGEQGQRGECFAHLARRRA